MANWLIKVVIFSLMVGCSSISSELQTKERLLLSSGENQQLVEFYKGNLAEVPSYKVKLVNLYLEMGDIKSAELYTNTYTAKDLDEPDYIYSLANLNYKKKRYDSALQESEKFLDEGGNEAAYHLLVGKIYAQRKEYETAIQHFEESRKSGASDREAGNNIAVVYLLQNRYVEATEILYDLYVAMPSDAKVRSNLIISSVQSNRPDIALEVLKHEKGEEDARKQLAALMKTVNKGKNKGKKAVQPQVAQINKDTTRATVVQTAQVTPKAQEETKKVEQAKPVSNVVTANNVVPVSKLDVNNLKPKAPSLYRIQVLASYKAVPNDYLNFLKANYGTVYSYTHGLWKRYCIGEFTDIEEAKAFLNSLNIKGAFVVDYTKKRYVEL
ncbi:Flp pilus assembly protein TadD [Vibrio vulnificus YJ016]|uniref:Flp pilus assembly protein TadD n=1 Tax=Vibrio vulnificus (strain YJ016) TaxID=196600 RepID=Q7MES1_VIBVY|nr:tetratricopeptide repeat protein [Vibrio vulnificus]AIL72663.1 Flp pilus assembly protein TadD [Vibrio vulnificus]ANN28584.1 pilus assembly protein TadD [Vibrio vulnificus]EGR0790204.1 tetratricopeptide repeat protein [Vibrio vulnificus]EGR0799267.1 tetratricopeptide repeat protein [Vibrio vulnificus]EGR0815903.1 tetratricopeptide repeat protein [Vibrio vulnificus]